MEEYYCSNVSSAPLISSANNGGTSGKKQPLSSNSAQDIWADFDCAIEMGHQLRKEERMEQLNRAYLARAPTSIDEGDHIDGVSARNECKTSEYQEKLTQDGHTIQNISCDITEFNKPQASKEEEILAKSKIGIITKTNAERQCKESKTSLLEDLQGEYNTDQAEHREAYSRSVKDDIYTATSAEFLEANPHSRESSENGFMPDDILNDFTLENELWQDSSRFEENTKPMPSFLMLRTMISLENTEDYVSKETSLNQILVSQTDSRINVPVNTPVDSLTTFPTSFMESSMREDSSAETAANKDWYTSSIGQLRNISKYSMEHGLNEEIEEMFKRKILQDTYPASVCPEPEKPPRSEIVWFGPEMKTPRDVLQNSSKSSSSDPGDDSSRLIRKLTESSDEDIPASKIKDQHDLTDRRIIEPKRNDASKSFQKNATRLINVERRDSLLDLGLPKKRETKPQRNFIVVKPINYPLTESLPRDKDQSADASVELSRPGHSLVTNNSQHGHSLRHRIGRAVGKAARRIRSALRMCSDCQN